MRFLCDEMLKGLGKWLRAAGYDTTFAHDGEADRSAIRRARDEGRLLLTRDRKMTEHKAGRGVVLLLSSADLCTCAAELSRCLGVDWLHRPFSRCLRCNELLEPADRSCRSLLPPKARSLPGPLLSCPSCSRLYWQGTHVARMKEKLSDLAGAG